MKGTDTGQRNYRPVLPYWCRHIAVQSAHPLLKERSEVEKIALLSSTQHISPETCPTLMLHGEQDSVVYPLHSMKFYELFGISLQFSDQKVTTLLSNRIGPSVQLGLQAVAFGTVVGIVLGVIAAMKQYMDRHVLFAVCHNRAFGAQLHHRRAGTVHIRDYA